LKSAKRGATFFFVDESGDPTFYDSHGNLIVGEDGCSPILIIGFITTDEPQLLRRELFRLKKELAADKYLMAVPSLQKSLYAFHAKDDCPEVRQAVFKLIVDLPFNAQFVVARKLKKSLLKVLAATRNGFTIVWFLGYLKMC
jgi:hypothetical protein